MNRHETDASLPAIDESLLEANQRWLEQQGPGLLPPQCALAVQRYDRSVTSLPEVTDAKLKNAVEKRRREFSAGRVAAAAALKELGANDSFSISVGAGRNPLWPDNFTGSITHTSGLAVAAVARIEILATVGIDLERTNAVQPELWPSILRASEIDFVSRKPPMEQSRWATLLFCAKESFYKMQYPVTGEWVEFHDAEVLVSEKGGEFELVCSQASVAGKLQHSRFAGRYLSSPEFFLTALWLSAGQFKLPAT